jgi:phosphoribosylanthranilate isomerase
MIKVKICGITNLEDAKHAASVGADMLGFIFTPKSPRCISLAQAKKIMASLDPFVAKCGVFMDQDKEEVLSIARECKVDVLQFHGRESPTYCRAFMPQFKVIKVLFPADMPFEKTIERYGVDAYLFDVKFDEKKSGVKRLPLAANNEIAQLIKNKKRVIISSGLNVENVDSITKMKPYAVDVASGVEKFVGEKDHTLVEAFIKKAKGIL